EKVKEIGLVVDGKPNPLLAEMRQISKTVYTYQNKLGLNPSDRLRFRKVETEEIDELSEFQDEL
ncbi:P27 family phage terminase small subunit, partial [Bacillus paranthracis]